MDEKVKVSILQANYLEFHYKFEDDSHSMNAIVFNKCEGEVLAILKEFSQKLQIQIEVETEPIEQGSLRSWLKIKGNSGNVTIKDLILIAAIGGFAANVFSSPITTTISEVINRSIDLIFEDDEITRLKELREKKQLELDILKIEEELRERSTKIDENIIIKRRSNFYSNLKQYPKVRELSISLENNQRQTAKECHINRLSFDSYVLETDDIDPIVESNAIIEIVSPVLKKGKYRWAGILSGEVIQFKMSSVEFKTLVQSGKIVFKNGFTIDCELAIHRKMTNEGEIKITSYEVLLVNQYYENDNPIETPEGRRKRQKREAELQQLNLFN